MRLKANFGIVGSWRDFGVETRVWATVVFSVGKKCSSFSSQCVYASSFLVLQPGPNVSWCEGVLITQSLFSVMMSLTLPSRTTNETLLIFLSFFFNVVPPPPKHSLNLAECFYLSWQKLGELGSYLDMCVCCTKIVSLEAGLLLICLLLFFLFLPSLPQSVLFLNYTYFKISIFPCRQLVSSNNIE